MDQYRGAPYNPFAPTFGGGQTVDEAKIPQIDFPQAVAPITEESTMDKIGDVAIEKGGDYAADKGGAFLEKGLKGIFSKGAAFTPGAASAGPMGYLQTAAGNTIGGGAASAAAQGGAKGAAGAGAGATAAGGGALAGIGAAMAPVLPFVIGAMALKSIFKK
jgi:hypothetical protein